MTLTEGQQTILDRLDKRMKIHGVECWATPDTIHEWTKFNIGGAKRFLKQLVELGLAECRDVSGTIEYRRKI